MGRRGTPRRLGVPGEEQAKVVYDIVEMEDFAGRRVLVVGGGDSAIESALGLANQPGTTVHLSYRGSDFARAKDRNRDKLDAAVAKGTVTLLLGSTVREVRADVVVLDVGGESMILPNDDVVVRIGGDAPVRVPAADRRADRAEGCAPGARPGQRELSMRPLLIMIATFLVSSSAAAQISPGPLARPHAALEGATQCLRCHPVGKKEAMDGACLSCHREIGWLGRSAARAARARGPCEVLHLSSGSRRTGVRLVPWTRDCARAVRSSPRRLGPGRGAPDHEVRGVPQAGVPAEAKAPRGRPSAGAGEVDRARNHLRVVPHRRAPRRGQEDVPVVPHRGALDAGAPLRPR